MFLKNLSELVQIKLNVLGIVINFNTRLLILRSRISVSKINFVNYENN